MEEPSSLASMWEQALSAEIAHRCRRAYVHEVKNGLQPIYAGIEALNRALRPVVPGSAVEKCLTLTRQALTHHEQALERSLDALTGADRETTEPLPLGPLLSELGRFMAGDAAFRDVRLSIECDTSACILASRGVLRLVLTSLLVDCIDSQPPGGEVTITTELAHGKVIVQFLDQRVGGAVWSQTGATEAASNVHPLRQAVRRLAAGIHGVLESAIQDDSRHRLRLVLPRAEAVDR